MAYGNDRRYKPADKIKFGYKIKEAAKQLPHISLDATLHPLTDALLQIYLTVTPDFTWNERNHEGSWENWWIWVETQGLIEQDDRIIHAEFFGISKRQVISFDL